MEKFRCEECQREFATEEGLKQHNRDKHSMGIQSKHELKEQRKQERERQTELERKKVQRKRMIKLALYIIVPIAIIGAVFAFVSSQPAATASIYSAEIPKGPIHWHPILTIEINGQQQIIPANLGAVGVHQPIHTHDITGTLHYENNNPTPENMPLRYFFEKVWRKQFNNICILDYCNGDSGTVKMFVNGKENFDFENYIPKDGDQIRIEYS